MYVRTYLRCWQKKQRLSSFRIYTSPDASWLERTQFRKEKVSLRLQHCWIKAAQQHSKNLLFGFFSLVFFVRGRHDMLAPRLPSFHDGSILSENFCIFPTQTNFGRNTQSLWRPPSFFSIPLRVLVSSLRFFPCFHRITVYSDEIWRGCLCLLAWNDAILPPPRPTFRFDHP